MEHHAVLGDLLQPRFSLHDDQCSMPLARELFGRARDLGRDVNGSRLLRW